MSRERGTTRLFGGPTSSTRVGLAGGPKKNPADARRRPAGPEQRRGQVSRRACRSVAQPLSPHAAERIQTTGGGNSSQGKSRPAFCVVADGQFPPTCACAPLRPCRRGGRGG